jgi:hypothetical protein
MSIPPKHTPGPYQLEKRTTKGEFGTDWLIVDTDKSVLAKLHWNNAGNAPLFIAAPEMLAHLRLLNAALACPTHAAVGNSTDRILIEQADALIAKVEGKV